VSNIVGVRVPPSAPPRKITIDILRIFALESPPYREVVT